MLPDDPIPAEPAPDASLSGPLEALLLMATEPVAASDLAQALGAPVPAVTATLQSLARFYDDTGRGFELRQVGSGWRYYIRSMYDDVIAASLLEGQQGRLSQAALETLAVVAYLQPITRGRVSAVRGVNVDGVIRTLTSRDLIEEVGRDPETGARLLGTTVYFLERMGLTALSQLPPLAPHLPDASALEAELASLAAAPTEGAAG